MPKPQLWQQHDPTSGLHRFEGSVAPHKHRSEQRAETLRTARRLLHLIDHWDQTFSETQLLLRIDAKNGIAWAVMALVVEEANSIGTTYLRAGYLPEPYASQSRELLREYAGERLNLVELTTHAAARQRSEEIQPLLWAMAQKLATTQPANPVLALYIDSLNQTIDLHTSRVTALTTARIPFTIYVGMYLVALLGLAMLGFQSGINGKRNLLVTLVLILVFSSVMLLIIDLDRSWGGLIRVDQQPMIDLISSFASFE